MAMKHKPGSYHEVKSSLLVDKMNEMEIISSMKAARDNRHQLGTTDEHDHEQFGILYQMHKLLADAHFTQTEIKHERTAIRKFSLCLLQLRALHNALLPRVGAAFRALHTGVLDESRNLTVEHSSSSRPTDRKLIDWLKSFYIQISKSSPKLSTQPEHCVRTPNPHKPALMRSSPAQRNKCVPN